MCLVKRVREMGEERIGRVEIGICPDRIECAHKHNK